MYIRVSAGAIFFLTAMTPIAAHAATPSNPATLDVIKAQANLERVRDLVHAGAVAPAKLAEAEDAVGDAKDDEVLRGTLYGNLTVQDLTEKQSEDMVAAAQRRYDRQKAKVERYQNLVAAGVLARGEIAPLKVDLDSRRITVDLARNRAKLLEDLATMARAESLLMQRDETATHDHALMQRFDGDGVFSPADLKKISR